MNEKFNKNAKVEQLTKVVLSHGEEKGLIVKDPFVYGVVLWYFRTSATSTLITMGMYGFFILILRLRHIIFGIL